MPLAKPADIGDHIGMNGTVTKDGLQVNKVRWLIVASHCVNRV